MWKQGRRTILFIGNFLSEKTGTKGISERLFEKLKSEIYIKSASKVKNKVIRLLDIAWKIIFYKYDLLHIDVFSGLAFAITRVAVCLAKIRGKKIVLTLHGGNLPALFKQKRDLVVRVLSQAYVLQTPSLMLRQRAQELLDLQVSYLPNFIDLEKFPYKRDNVKHFSMLWVRAFTSIYNPEMAISTLLEVKKRFPEVTLTMVGPDKGSLNTCMVLIQQLGLVESVHITGPVNNDMLYEYYHTHEVYLNTTSYESFGVAVLEAASCGIPVVSNNVGEIPYLWTDQENMLLIPHLDVVAMASAVIRLIEEHDLSHRLSVNARKNAERFSWESLKPKWIALLNQRAI